MRSRNPTGGEMSQYKIIIDTREKTPLKFTGIETIRAGLKTGDYSIEGFEDKITIERKSLADLIQSISRDRRRFEECIQRLLEYEAKALLIEATPMALQEG